MRRQKLEGVGYSYIRFSAKEQERGDSLRRQTDLRDDWLKRNPGVKLDESITLRDLGVSAFRGLHRKGDTHALGQFLKLVESGRVAKGAMLLLENLDRLSREDELAATHLFTGILLAGIRIVQLEPEVVFDRNSGQLEIMRAVLELGRAHAESARKSKRVTEAWNTKKRAAASEGKPMTGRCPAWLEVVGGKYAFKPSARDLIRRMIRMCTDGHGCRAIAATFRREKIKPWSPARVKGNWEEAYIRKVIGNRAILGEYQPMTNSTEGDGKRVPDGPTLANYFPAAVTETAWEAAWGARKLRDNRGGRPPKEPEHVNIFGGLLVDARTGKSLQINGRTDRGRYYRVLVPSGSRRHGDECISFPLDAFVTGVLALLAEIDPREILPDGGDDGKAILELSGQLTQIERRLATMQSQMVEGDGDVSAIMAAVRQLEAKRKETADALASARAKAAKPQVVAWGDARGLIEVLRDAPDPREARIRLRAALRQVVVKIECLFRPRNGLADRLAQVVVWFAGGQHRSYIILASPDGVRAKSIAAKHVVDDPASPQVPYVKERVKWLESVDLAELKEKLPLVSPKPNRKAK